MDKEAVIAGCQAAGFPGLDALFQNGIRYTGDEAREAQLLLADAPAAGGRDAAFEEVRSLPALTQNPTGGA